MLGNTRIVWGFAVTSILFLPFCSHADAARWVHRGPRGANWTGAATHYNSGGGNFGRTATMTRPNGEVATKSYNRSDSDGTITSDRSITGGNGGSASRTVTRTPGEGGAVTATGPNGSSYSSSWTQ